MPPSRTNTNTVLLPVSAAPLAAVEVTNKDDPHVYRRRFIGPMPEKAFAGPAVRKRRKKASPSASASESSSDDDESLKDTIRKHAYQFFLGHGGRQEDWGEDKERGVREDMLQRWRESEWGRARAQRKEARSARRWVGTSFDIGVFLGLNIMDGPSLKRRDSKTRPSLSPCNATSAGAETFVTAASHFSRPPIPVHLSSPQIQPSRDDEEGLTPSAPTVEADELNPASASSSTARLLRPDLRGDIPSQARTEAARRPALIANSAQRKVHSEQALDHSTKPHVSFGGIISKDHEAIVEESPASPQEVLSRTGADVVDSSAGAAEEASVDIEVEWGDVIMRDRMFVKVSYSDVDISPADFDEWKNRTTTHLKNWNWAEYIVAWRKDRLELYKDHSTPGRDWLSGHKELAFVVPLGSSTTRLSLYSFVDMTFCLLCPPARLRTHPRGHWLSYGSKKGTNIFVFKGRCRTRATDWLWKLWRHLGGQLPQHLEIRSPALDTLIKIDIPTHDTEIAIAYAISDPQNIISLCERHLSAVPEYNTLIKQRIEAGAVLELAWRLDTNLDWVWQLEDVQGHLREWAVLSGLALKQGGKSSHLELRLQEHRPSRIHLKDGTQLDEPPAIEGYLERIRPNSQSKQAVYLAVHDGYLFSLLHTHANHPQPPGLLSDADRMRSTQIKRGTRQILRATGMTDLRSIVAVRRAFQLVPRHAPERANGETSHLEDPEGFWEAVERTEEDDQDPGGDFGTMQAQEKSTLRMRRSFELLLNNGHVIRFETYSCHVALEWIVRLRPLVSYWKKRHQVDAQSEMDLAHFGTGRMRITPRTHVDSDDTPPEPLPDPDTSLPELSSFFHWCVLDGCRPILKCGKIFGQKGLWGQYQHLQLVLVSGALVQYRITGRASLHHRRHKLINLLDAYVCSGYIAAQYLPNGQYNADAPNVARRYQDGLETDDSEEDTLFMIWYRPRSQFGGDEFASHDYVSAPGSVPPLSAKRKLAVFRTRSKLERDTWVWAINVEIEKVVRATSDWEDKVRDTGELIKT